MALVPVVTGAGACMTDWQGRPLTLQSHVAGLAGVLWVLRSYTCVFKTNPFLKETFLGYESQPS